MSEALFYLVSSFWLGALHAATPGHGKTIAAAYIVGVRGRPVDAIVLGIFVTLSHTIGIVLVAALATLSAAWSVPQRVEAYLAVATGMLVIGIGLWMFRVQWTMLRTARRAGADLREPAPVAAAHEHGNAGHHHPHDHSHDPVPREAGEPEYHRHGWGPSHTHDIERITQSRPSLPILLGLALAGGLLPDPGALVILLAAIASGRLVLGLFTVLVFSLGFASVLVVVGVVAAHVGRLVLVWLSGRWISWLQVGTALLIIAVGIVLTVNAWRTLAVVL